MNYIFIEDDNSLLFSFFLLLLVCLFVLFVFINIYDLFFFNQKVHKKKMDDEIEFIHCISS
jgi:hypothetical protein